MRWLWWTLGVLAGLVLLVPLAVTGLGRGVAYTLPSGEAGRCPWRSGVAGLTDMFDRWATRGMLRGMFR